MGSAFANFAANKELKDRILFTMVMFFVFRLGVHIPVPGVDTSILESLFSSGNLFGFLDLFSGSLSEQIFTFCHEYYPIHQLFHYYAASDFRYSHIGRMAERRAGRV